MIQTLIIRITIILTIILTIIITIKIMMIMLIVIRLLTKRALLVSSLQQPHMTTAGREPKNDNEEGTS